MTRFISFLFSTDGSIYRKIFRSTVWVGLSKICLNSLSLIRSIILARLLAPEVFGLMSICLIAVRGLELFSQTGVTAALIHKQDNFDEAKDTAFSVMIIRGFILGTILFFLAPIFSQYYDETVLEQILKFMCLIFILNGFHNINIVKYEKELDFKRLTFLEQSENIFNFVFIVAMAYYYRSIWALVFGQIASSLYRLIFSYVLIRGHGRIRFNKGIARDLFSYGKYITALTIVLFITSEIDNLFIGKLLGMEVLGFYVIAYTLSNFPATHISKIISTVLFPAYSKLQHDFKQLRELYLTMVDLISKFTFPAFCGMFILSKEIIIFVYGSKWENSIDVLRVLCIFAVIRSISSINGYVYNAIGKPYISFYVNISKLIIILLIIYPLTNLFGIMGAAYAITIPTLITFPVTTYIMKKVLNISLASYYLIILRNLCTSIIMSVSIVFASNFIPIENIYHLIAFIFLGIIIYGFLNIRFISFAIKNKTVPLLSG